MLRLGSAAGVAKAEKSIPPPCRFPIVTRIVLHGWRSQRASKIGYLIRSSSFVRGHYSGARGDLKKWLLKTSPVCHRTAAPPPSAVLRHSRGLFRTAAVTEKILQCVWQELDLQTWCKAYTLDGWHWAVPKAVRILKACEIVYKIRIRLHCSNEVIWIILFY